MRIFSNKIKDIIRFAKQELKDIYDEKEIESILFLLFSHILDWSIHKVLLEKESTVSESVLLKFNFAIKDLKKQKPIQYIVGKTQFRELSFAVNENVLIPRPETEELIQLILDENTLQSPKILDIGTGSGCIAISLAYESKDAHVLACDISEEALKIAFLNAEKNKVNIDFLHLDILNSESTLLGEKLDIIVSNPPYVCHSEKAQMKENVLSYEPHLALFVEDTNPLIYYQYIINFALNNLEEKGKLYFEINEKFGQEILQMLLGKGFEACLCKDINNKDRFIKAWL